MGFIMKSLVLVLTRVIAPVCVGVTGYSRRRARRGQTFFPLKEFSKLMEPGDRVVHVFYCSLRAKQDDTFIGKITFSTSSIKSFSLFETSRRRTQKLYLDMIEWPLQFKTLAKCSKSKARTSIVKLPHFDVETPMFMPVGTQGTMKGMTCDQLRSLDCQIILANTYHLGMRPGVEILNLAGRLHQFMNWDRALLTDSGGFQMVSLIELSEVTEEGVKFRSPYDNRDILLTPEKSMEIQNAIGADIMMQLDDVVDVKVKGPRVEEAMHRSIRWLDRCIVGHKRKAHQNLFPIIQGGLNLELRSACIKEMVMRDMPGYAIGGLSGGEAKDDFWRVVHHCTGLLPKNKPIYVMGVGYAVDLVVCSALGADMFDCVYPTRTARFGTALVRTGQLHLKSQQYATDFEPIDSNCSCSTCATYSRAFIHSLIGKESVACHLITVHNIKYQMSLMAELRQSLKDDCFEEFVQNFMLDLFPDKNYPKWACDAFNAVNIELIT